MPQKIRFTIFIVVAYLVAACGSPDARRSAFTRDLVRLETDAALGHYDEAAAQSVELLQRAIGVKETCPVLVAQARALAGQERVDDAMSAYRRIAAECAQAPAESSMAMLHLARWIAQQDGPSDAALAVLESLVLVFPNESAARLAVDWIRDLMLPNAGPIATGERLVTLADRVQENGAVAANLLYDAGALFRDSAVDDTGRQRALVLFERVVSEHPQHGLSNDALMAQARLLRTLGRPKEAVIELETLLARREWSFLFLSYDVDLYRKASKMLPEIAREAGEPESEVARREREYRRRYPAASD